MRVLLTGAFGNVGQRTLKLLIERGHTVRCFDLKTPANEKAARRFCGRVELFWGDLRRPEDVAAAVEGQDVVVHLAFVIPKLSATGIESEEHPEWAYAINVDGTRNLIQAIQSTTSPQPKLLFTSSYHVYGKTQHLQPPRKITDPVNPQEHYARHKVICEQMVKSSGLTWAIFRLAAALPVRLILDPGMFDVPLDNRIEFVYSGDVALAIANALETDAVWGRTWLIGGGPRCQYTYRELVSRTLEAMGIGMLPDEAFSTTPFATDWMDTTESERVLHYQRHDLQDYIQDMKKELGMRRYLIWAFRPAVRYWLLRESPYCHDKKRLWQWAFRGYLAWGSLRAT
ncbi:MAG: NAD(P)-dependent oxidoreductase [Anaerolineae bacterium]|nr:NAD(P)-dependent oxidoreductase [Anaerolineae bacterium]